MTPKGALLERRELNEKVSDGAFASEFEAGDLLFTGPARKARWMGKDWWVYPNGHVLPAVGGGQVAAPGGGTSAGHPQPQTSTEAPGGPFIRHSQPGRAPQYNTSGGFNSIVTQPLVARPGYFRKLLVNHWWKVAGNAVASVAWAPDGPENVASLVQFKDGFGTPLIIAPGFETYRLIPMFSGGHGLEAQADIRALPSFTLSSTFQTITGKPATVPIPPALGATTAVDGSSSFISALPLEFAKGYGVLAAANASILPTLQINTNAAASLYTTAPTTLPTVVNTQLDSDFYWLPEGVDIEPPGLGTTRQWVLQQANPSITANGSTRVQLPRLGGFLDTIILVMRNAAGARVDDMWPARMQILVDGVPWIDSGIDEILDDMAITWPGITRPAGVLAISRKTSLSQKSLGLLDTGEVFLSTNPGSLVEVNGSPWAGGAGGPDQLNVLIGQVVPTGALVQGLPEV